MESLKVSVYPLEGNEQSNNLTMEQVWDELREGGMRAFSSRQHCNYFNDTVPYKSATFICEKNQVEDVKYWISYCGCSVSKSLVMSDGKIVLRADYQCW